MSKEIKLAATIRTEHPKAVRRQTSVPAVLYGAGLETISVQVDGRQFQKVLSQAGHTSLINLDITGASKGAGEHTVLIREVQYHPVRDNILHIDFYQVRLDQVIRANVPLNFVGESPAVKDLGGVLVRSLDEVELEALPADLPHDIEVDISMIKDFDTVINIKDLNLPEKVELFHEPEDVVAVVQPPRTEEELEALDEEVSEDVEGVEGVEDKETEEGTEGEEGEAAEAGEKPAEETSEDKAE